jgi:hypothetical protein
MAEARSQQAWSHTSAVLALLANVHRDPKKSRTYKQADFNPHLRDRLTTAQRPKAGVGVLKQVFIKEKQGE